MTAFYAHSLEGDKSTWQPLKSHLINTANLALKLGHDSNLSQYAYVVALLHDIGKYSIAFQKRLEGSPKKVDHSTAGTIEIRKLFEDNPTNKIISEMLSYCIAGHHRGLLDYGSPIDLDSTKTLQGRLKKNIEDYSQYKKEIDVNKLSFPDHLSLNPTTKDCGFTLSFFTRMIYSILVDADFLDTEFFMNQGSKNRGSFTDLKILCNTFNKFLEKFDHPNNRINQQRTDTLKMCINRAADKPGIFSLTVPTGGGKTYSSLAFAMNHASIYDMKHIIYVIPYTSIIDQNATVIKKCLGPENILEHHSNFDWEQKDFNKEEISSDDKTNKILDKLKLASENWDVPIIMTTNVQFFESLFSNRVSRCRKLHNIAKSVIIFDEAQMLPIEYLKPSLMAVYELVKNYGSTALFCTATQPPIKKFLPNEAIITEIIPEPQKLFNFYKRTEVKKLGKVDDKELLKCLNENQQVLCIVNTRRHAKELFSGLEEIGRFHLSTLMCPVHRKKTIKSIQKKLKEGKPCRVVSTQIIEAGIDLDFPVGYRALAGIDSIIQAAGRVNREGKYSQDSILYVFEPDSPYSKHIPPNIQQAAEVANNVLRNFEGKDPICIQAINDYYLKLYNLLGENNFDQKRILDCFEQKIPGEIIFNFETASEKFKVIDSPTVPIVIPFDNIAKNIIMQVKTSKFPRSFSRKLQLYTINIFENEYLSLQSLGQLERINDTYDILANTEINYDNETGLIIPSMTGGNLIYF